MRQVCATFVPQVLNDEQKEFWMTIASEFFEHSMIDPRFRELFDTTSYSSLHSKECFRI